MTTRRCEFCGSVIYGRSDKRYCSSTCRRDACRARHRVIHLHDWVIEGQEWGSSGSLDRQIPRLERIYGPNHRVVKAARGWVEDLETAEMEALRESMRSFSWGVEFNEDAPGEPNA
jgi:hypothetical protein